MAHGYLVTSDSAGTSPSKQPHSLQHVKARRGKKKPKKPLMNKKPCPSRTRDRPALQNIPPVLQPAAKVGRKMKPCKAAAGLIQTEMSVSLHI